MVPVDLLTVPLDFLLILLVNGNPAAECVPMVIVQDTSLEMRESYLHCRTEEGREFGAQAAALMRVAPNALNVETGSEITLQLSER